MWLPILWLLILAAFTNAIALSSEADDEDVSVEDPGHPKQPYYDPRHDDDSYYYKNKYKKPTTSEDAIFLPHEKFCQYFYAFDGRESSIFRCQSGYRFDAEKLQCLKSKYVSCGKRKKDVGSSEEKHVGVNFKCPKWSGAHPHNYYCHLFFYCQNKKPSLFMCPPGKLFDKKINGCLPQNQVKCEKRENPYEDDDPDDISQPDPESKDVQCPDKAGIYPDPKFCHKYIRCWYGFGEVYVCPNGKLYDEDLNRCRFKNSVYCHNKINPYAVKDDEEPTLVDENPNFQCRTNWGRFPHEECNQFYQCEGGYPQLFKCPEGKMFDSDSRSCKIASEVTCNKEITDEDNDDEFICPAREGVFKDEEDCGSYYKCKKGKAQRLQCPEGELFDTDWKSCSDENQVTCDDRSLPGDDEAGNEEESIIDENPKYNCEKRHGRFTHKEYCNWFYHCKDGRPSVRSCKNGKYYDSYKHNCYDEVECGPRKPKPDHEKPKPKPHEFSCPSKSGKFPDPRDCGAYYVCEKYKHKHRHCPKGKLFHDKWLSCSDENSVTCGNRNHPDVDPEDRENKVVDPNPRFECKAKYGQYDHEEYCDWYYNCQDSKATLKECKKGKYYDSNRRKCQHSKEVSCGHRRKPDERDHPTTTEKTIATRRPEFRCPQAHGKFPHERDCSKFYDCKGWNHKEHKCPKHKLFDSRRQSCEDDEHVNCDERIHPDMDPDEPDDKIVDPNPRFNCKNNYGRFTHDEYCHYYYNCHNKKPTVRECRHGRYYDSRRRKCYDSKEVSCEGRRKPDDSGDLRTTTETIPTRRPEFRCPQAHGKFPHERDCNKFYDCKGWNHKEHKCPKHKLFDSRRQSCEDDDHVICDERIHPDMDPDEPEDKIVDPNPRFNCKNNYGRFTHDEYCHYYYNCHNKKPTVRECRHGRYYDSKRRKCYDSKEVSCEGRRKPDDGGNLRTTTEDYITPVPKFQCPKGEGKYPHERDCGKFYECRQWQYKVHACPKHQLFNEKPKKCEPEERVTCGNRIHPEDDPDEPEDKIVEPNPNFNCPSYFGRYDHRNCDWYFHCKDRRPSVRECKRGKYYDRHSRKCKNSVDVNCEDRIKPEDRVTYKPEKSTTSSQQPTTTTKDEITTTKRPTSTSTTEKDLTTTTINPRERTERTESQETTTKSTTMTSISTKPTESTTKETAKITPKPEISTQTTDEPTTEFDDNPDKIIDREPQYDCAGDEGDFAHDAYCHYYYSCQKNKVTLRECPEGKYFDIERGYCEDWYLVSCGDRLTPEELGSTFDEFQSTPYIERRPSTIITEKTTTEEPVSEKPKFDCPSDGLYPHKRNCGKYYLCINGIAEEKLCPEKQLYDVEKKACNEEQETNCGERIHPNDDPDNPNKIPDKVIDPNPKFNCTDRHGCFSHEMFCKWYYYCHDKRPEVRECSGDQYFDSVRNKCLDWWMVFCDNRTIPEGTPTPPTTDFSSSSGNTNGPTEGSTEGTIGTDNGSTTNKDQRTEATTDNQDTIGTKSNTEETGVTKDDLGTGSTPSGIITGSTNAETRQTDRNIGTLSTDDGQGTKSTSSDRDTGFTKERTRMTDSSTVTRSTGENQVTGSTPSGKFTASTDGRTRTDSGKETRSTKDGTQSTKFTSSDRITDSTNGRTTESGKETRSTKDRDQGTRSTPSGRVTGSTDSRTKATSDDIGTRSTGTGGQGTRSTPSGRGTGSTDSRTKATSDDIGTRSTGTGDQGTRSTPNDIMTDSTDGRTTEDDKGTRSTREGDQSTRSTPSGRVTGSTDSRTKATSDDIGTRSTGTGDQGTRSTPNDIMTDSTDGRTTEDDKGTRSTKEGDQSTRSTSTGRITGSTEGITKTSDSGLKTPSTSEENQGTGSTDGRTRTDSGRETRSTKGGNQSTRFTPSDRVTGSSDGISTESEKGTRSTRERDRPTKSTSSGRITDSTERRPKTTSSIIGTRSTRNDDQGTRSTPNGRISDSTDGRTTESGKGTRSTGGEDQGTRSTSSGRVTGSTEGKISTTNNEKETFSTRGENQGTGSTPSGRFTGSTDGRTRTDSSRETQSTKGDKGTKSTSSDRITDSTGRGTTESGRGTRSTRNRGTRSTPSSRVTGSTEGRTRTSDSGIGTPSTRREEKGTKSTSGDGITGFTEKRPTTTDNGSGTRSTIEGNTDPTTGISTPDKPITDKCKEEDGDFHHPDDCSKYYTCKDGDYTINDCISGMLFDKNLRRCEREERVDCDGRKKPEVTTDDCDEWLRTSTIADDHTTKPTREATGPTDKGTGGTEITITSSENLGSTTNQVSVETKGYTESDLPNSSDSSITNDPTKDSGLTKRPPTDFTSDSTNSDPFSENFSDSTTNNDVITETGITGRDISTPNIETEESKTSGESESTTENFTNSPVTEITTDSSGISTVSTRDESTENTIITKENSSKEPTETNFETEETSEITEVQTDLTDRTISTTVNRDTETTHVTKENEPSDSTVQTVTILEPTLSTTSESGKNTDSSAMPTSTNDNTENPETTTKDNGSEESTIKTVTILEPTVSTTSESGKNTDSSGIPTSTNDNTENPETTTKDNGSEESTIKTVTILEPTVSTTSESGKNTDSSGIPTSTNDNTENPETTTKDNGSEESTIKTVTILEPTVSTTSESGKNTESSGIPTSTNDNTENPETTTKDNGSEESTIKTVTILEPTASTTSESGKNTGSTRSEIGTTTSNPISKETSDKTTEQDNETLETRSISERTPAQPELSTSTPTPNTKEVSDSTENFSTDNIRTGYPSTAESETDVSNTNDVRTDSNTNTDNNISEGTQSITTEENDQTASTQTISTLKEEVSTVTETETTEHTTLHPCLTHTHGTALPTEPTKIDCDSDDIKCIEKKTGDVKKWFKCPTKEGLYPHPLSNRIFIMCERWKPKVKRCGRHRIFSTKYNQCISF